MPPPFRVRLHRHKIHTEKGRRGVRRFTAPAPCHKTAARLAWASPVAPGTVQALSGATRLPVAIMSSAHPQGGLVPDLNRITKCTVWTISPAWSATSIRRLRIRCPWPMDAQRGHVPRVFDGEFAGLSYVREIDPFRVFGVNIVVQVEKVFGHRRRTTAPAPVSGREPMLAGFRHMLQGARRFSHSLGV
jgi:hypothetical protein